jgi:hypothetical protein
MKTEDYINQFIEKEKEIEPNPFLSTRIMASIDKKRTVHSIPIWQTVIAVASISLVIFTGFQLSNLYNPTSAQEKGLVINDSHIEMLHYYQTESHE